jgi:hypothetical protein
MIAWVKHALPLATVFSLYLLRSRRSKLCSNNLG